MDLSKKQDASRLKDEADKPSNSPSKSPLNSQGAKSPVTNAQEVTNCNEREDKSPGSDTDTKEEASVRNGTKSLISSPLAMLEKTCQNIGISEMSLNGRPALPINFSTFSQKENVILSSSKDGSVRPSKNSPPISCTLKRPFESSLSSNPPNSKHLRREGVDQFYKNFAHLIKRDIVKNANIDQARSTQTSSNALVALSHLSHSLAYNSSPKAPTLTMMPGNVNNSSRRLQTSKNRCAFSQFQSESPLKVRTSSPLETVAPERMHELMKFVDEMSTSNEPSAILYMMLMKSLMETPVSTKLSPSPPQPVSPNKPTAVVNPACNKMLPQAFPKRNTQGQPVPCHCMYCGKFFPDQIQLIVHVCRHFDVSDNAAKEIKTSNLAKQENLRQSVLMNEQLQGLINGNSMQLHNNSAVEETTESQTKGLASYLDLLLQCKKLITGPGKTDEEVLDVDSTKIPQIQQNENQFGNWLSFMLPLMSQQNEAMPS
ncbi:hypothetical protein Ciccas_006219 [Cichlidogyrus casuarinus]|uniref:C2H2-type domain-containing protein n=1 Tax=Cichlidogyrus casuarinus TaxID=1844966 RepID=A0ABD2Q6D8_9PLAT